jgi:hypothetical protein
MIFKTLSNEDPANLLPLAKTGQPLPGGHDMALVPEQMPAPRAAQADTSMPHLDMPSASSILARSMMRGT